MAVWFEFSKRKDFIREAINLSKARRVFIDDGRETGVQIIAEFKLKSSELDRFDRSISDLIVLTGDSIEREDDIVRMFDEIIEVLATKKNALIKEDDLVKRHSMNREWLKEIEKNEYR